MLESLGDEGVETLLHEKSGGGAGEMSTDTERLREEIANEVSAMLTSNEDVAIKGFGTFYLRTYEAYTGRNPRTGEAVEVPEKKLVFFKATKAAIAYVTGDSEKTPDIASSTLVQRTAQRMEEDPEVLEAVLSDWTEHMLLRVRQGEAVAMKNLGFLRTFQKKERMGLNPQTGTEVLIPARTVLLMQPSNTLQEKSFKRWGTRVDANILRCRGACRVS